MTDTNLYFGRPGSLITIQHPRSSVEATRARPSSVFLTGGGGARVGKIVGGKRRYVLSWDRLWRETFADLESFDQGHQGPGPFALLDPGRVNWLTVNQSAATSETSDTDNFTVSGSGVTIASESTTFDRGPRSLRCNFTYTASGAVTLDAPSAQWSGIPVVASTTALAFSVYHRGGGSDAIMTVVPKLRWLDIAGATLSTSSGAGGTSSSGAFAVTSVVATAPASAAYVLCSIDITGSSAGSILYLDRFQLQRDAVGAWYPGTGVLPVEVVSFTEMWPWQASDYRERPTLTLQEVGP